ncbi:transglycosylase SLT domain-containing protein, partial [Escherichia coli]|nr:transglycosylase SLT domain-containing protein [Escherichia coli]
MPATVAHAQTARIELHAQSDTYAGLIAEAAQRFGIPAAWIRAIMRVESRGDWRAISPKGAIGLMQLMPDTWAALRARY